MSETTAQELDLTALSERYFAARKDTFIDAAQLQAAMGAVRT